MITTFNQVLKNFDLRFKLWLYDLILFIIDSFYAGLKTQVFILNSLINKYFHHIKHELPNYNENIIMCN